MGSNILTNVLLIIADILLLLILLVPRYHR